jgi:hypothetical protein
MLNSEVCFHCAEEYLRRRHGEKFAESAMIVIRKNWNDGFCTCYYASINLLVLDKPPFDCPYIVEQSVC